MFCSSVVNRIPHVNTSGKCTVRYEEGWAVWNCQCRSGDFTRLSLTEQHTSQTPQELPRTPWIKSRFPKVVMKPHRSACSLSWFHLSHSRHGGIFHFSPFCSSLGIVVSAGFFARKSLCPAFISFLPSLYLTSPTHSEGPHTSTLDSPDTHNSKPLQAFLSGILSQSETIYRFGYWVFLFPTANSHPNRASALSLLVAFVMDIGFSQPHNF